MASKMSIQEARTYALSNGITVDLIALIDTNIPEGWNTPEGVHDLAVGQVVYVYAMGSWRRGVVTKLGRTKASVAFTTQGAVDDAVRYYGGKGVRVGDTPAQLSDIKTAPAETMDEAIERTIARQTAAPAEVAAEWTVADQVAEGDRYEEELEAQELIGLPETLAPAEELDGSDPQAPAVPATGSSVVAALEALWAGIRANHPEVPEVVMVTGSGINAGMGPGRWGHHWAEGWTEHDHQVHAEGESAGRRVDELFIAGETLGQGARAVLKTALHEAAHAVARVRKVKDTSRQNRYHNGTFRSIAEELGLEYTADRPDPTIGFSAVTLAPGTEEDYAHQTEALNLAIRLSIRLNGFLAGTGEDGQEAGGHHAGGSKRKPRDPGAKSTGNVKATCGCPTPRIIRVSRATLAEGTIACHNCGQPFTSPEVAGGQDEED